MLRRAEALGEDMLREGTAPEGLTRPVSDTTLDRLLGSLEPEDLLEGKQGEATAFPELFKRVVEKFGRHFEYVTVDAGMTSAANARVVREAGKHYLMALKENFHRLHDKAWVALRWRR